MRHGKIVTVHDTSGKSKRTVFSARTKHPLRIFGKISKRWAKRRTIFALALAVVRKARRNHGTKPEATDMQNFAHGYDPELVYVECGHCGAPVLWEDGKATALLREAGIDPIELDPSCILVTDGCPACGIKNEYSVRIFRIASPKALDMPPAHGNA